VGRRLIRAGGLTSIGANVRPRVEEAAQRGHNGEWFANVKARIGSVPTILHFDLTMIVDNNAGSVTEFSPAAAQAAE
jgi:hypothetical protein